MPDIDIFRLDEDPFETQNGLRDDTSTRGVDLAGIKVKARYIDGSSETLVWQALDPYTNGGATGTDITMFYGSDWHDLSTTKALTSLYIDLKPASSVFDTTLTLDTDPMGGSTPGSKNGFPFRFAPDFAATAGAVTVTYSGIVNLVGRPADGDLYTTLLIDFSGLPTGGFLGSVDWNSDIDTLRDAGDLTRGVNFTLVSGVVETGSYGRNFNGTSDADGIARAGFTGAAEDLVLSFTGYDVDFADEIEVLLNGDSLGYLGTTANNATDTYQFDIPAADQLSGDNFIEFQNRNPNYNWGITDIMIEPGKAIDFVLAHGVAETGSYGRNFNGTSDADGIARAEFTGAAEDLVLSFTGYDVDFADEIEVLLNGDSIGYLGKTANNATDTYQFLIPSGDQLAGDNLIAFQNRNPNYNWGITDVMIQPGTAIDFTLAIGAVETGSYGRNFNGTSDEDGILRAGFTGTDGDLTLSLTGYDVDFADEIELLLNGESLGYLGTTANNGTDTFQFDIAAADQLSGDNYVEFHNRSPVYNWGITDVLLDDFLIV